MKLVFIIGDSAVGKMTVGQELMKITDLRLLITHEKPFMRCLFSSIYWSDSSMQSELERIQEKIDEITEEPVYSSGHAFI